MTSKIRVGIVGVGNCASALVQGVEFYKDANEDDALPGLMHLKVGDYGVSDVEFSCAFDVDALKVGTDLSKALVTEPNNTIRFAEIPDLGVTVSRGPTLDGLGRYYKETITESPQEAVDVVRVLKESETQILINYLPVGSESAARFYAQCALEAGVGFLNCIPVFLASNPEWGERFKDRGVPIIGDDIKSQMGSTIIHRVLARLFEDRGVTIDHTYQLNFGGNMDFKNMLERERLLSKKKSKTDSMTSQLRRPLPPEDVHIGPADYVPWLHDRKWAHIRIEGREFGGVPLTLDMKLEVWDSPNSAGIVVDALRCLRLAKDAGIGGPLVGPSAYLMKTPPVQYPDEFSKRLLEEFIAGHTTSIIPSIQSQ